MLTASLPDGTARQDDGDLTIIRWANDLDDEAELARRLSTQDQWLTGLLQPPIAPQFDDRGDRRTRVLPPPPDTVLRYYESDTGTGYVELQTGPAGAATTAHLEDAIPWLAAGTLPDGRPLHALYVITPDREAALRTAAHAQSGGVAGVYYVGSDGAWWDPFPPGPWIEETDQP